VFTVKTSLEFISDIRRLDECLSSIRLSKVEIDRKTKTIRYTFISDKTVSLEVKKLILEEAERITSPVFEKVEVDVIKIVTNDQLINNEVYKFLSENYPSVSIFLKPTDVTSVVVGDMVKYNLRLTEESAETVKRSGAVLKLNDHLSRKFCSDFTCNIEIKEADESINLLSEEVFAGQLAKIEHRTVKVKEVEVIDDITMGDTALYIEDAISGDVVISGKITRIAEKETKTGKPFFTIHLDDTTGRISGVYFTKKSTYPRIKRLQEGEAIIARGRIGEYNGNRSFTFDKINACVFPDDFVKKDKYKKKPPLEYTTVFPAPATSSVKICSVFDEEVRMPDEVYETEYVVFDLETTGTSTLNDQITEIGAVKIKNGKVVEQFQTLVKPTVQLSKEIVELTGITDEMLKDAPKIQTVIPDFMKFINGATLIAHNADFDMGFMKKFAQAEDYEIKNKVIDTMIMWRNQYPHLKAGLGKIAEYLGITFNHHRALADAYTTAEVFFELMKSKNKK